MGEGVGFNPLERFSLGEQAAINDYHEQLAEHSAVLAVAALRDPEGPLFLDHRLSTGNATIAGNLQRLAQEIRGEYIDVPMRFHYRVIQDDQPYGDLHDLIKQFGGIIIYRRPPQGIDYSTLPGFEEIIVE